VGRAKEGIMSADDIVKLWIIAFGAVALIGAIALWELVQ
jgi:hypothetical protein